jgi:hypothetical protein
MMRYDPSRADARPIHEKALSLIFAMDDAAAANLHSTLARMATGTGAGAKRAQMFKGSVETEKKITEENEDEK